jgi:hypothetical protein
LPIIAFGFGKEYQRIDELNRRNNDPLLEQTHSERSIVISPTPTPLPTPYDAEYWSHIFLTPIPTPVPLIGATVYVPKCKPFAGQAIFIPNNFQTNDNPEDSISDVKSCKKGGITYSSIDYGCLVLLGYLQKPGSHQDPYSSVAVYVEAKTKNEMPCFGGSVEDISKTFSNPIQYFEIYNGADQKDLIGIRKIKNIVVYVYKKQSNSTRNAFYGAIVNDVAYSISYDYFQKGMSGQIKDLESISLIVDQLATQFFANIK